MDVHYKGYIIRPTPMQLTGGRGWNLYVYICRDRDNKLVERKFGTGDIYATKEEATKHCINLAKQIIDGQHAELSVDDL